MAERYGQGGIEPWITMENPREIGDFRWHAWFQRTKVEADSLLCGNFDMLDPAPRSKLRRIRLAAYGARLERVLG